MLIPVDRIRIPEVRASSRFTPEQEAFFKATVERFGVLQPILVRKLEGDEYELIAGLSRLREQQEQGKREVEAMVIETDSKEALLMHLAENLARGQTDPISEGAVFKDYLDKGGTKEELAALTGHRKEYIDFRIALLALPDYLKDALGVVVKTGDVTHPTSLEIEFTYPDWAEKNERLLEQTLKAFQQFSDLLKGFVEPKFPERKDRNMIV